MTIPSTYSVVASPLHPAELVESAVRPICQALEKLGATQDPPVLTLPHVYVLATGGTEELLLQRVRDRHRQVGFEPVVVIAHPTHNSLPAAMESVARLHQLGMRAVILQLTWTPGGEVNTHEIEKTLTDLDTIHRLHRCRIGLIGTPSEWLVASVPPAATVRNRWGPTLVEVEMTGVLAEARTVPVSLGRRVTQKFSAGSTTDLLPPPEDVSAAAHVHPVLESVISLNDLDAVTVRCFDFLTELETSGCIALAQLNDEGVVAGCEGDIPAALAMLWVRYLLNQPSWIANPASVDLESNELELAHCTIAPSMTEHFSLSTHFESGIGVGIHGHLGAGPVTLIRIGGLDLDRVWLADGAIVGSGSSAELCRTQARVKVEGRPVAELLSRPLGNHLVMVAGHHAKRLERWWSMAVADPAG